MDKLGNFLDFLVSGLVAFVSLQDIQSTISIIIIVIKSIYIVVRLFFNTYNLYKNNQKDKITDEFKEFNNSLGDIIDNGRLDNSNKGDENEQHK